MDKSEYEKMNVKKLVETICFLKEQNQKLGVTLLQAMRDMEKLDACEICKYSHNGSCTAPKELTMASFPGDAIQIVRCKDCKWFADNNGGEWYGCKMFHVVRITPEDAPKPDDFCSYGERREE